MAPDRKFKTDPANTSRKETIHCGHFFLQAFEEIFLKFYDPENCYNIHTYLYMGCSDFNHS
jgi:hypothetical protein